MIIAPEILPNENPAPKKKPAWRQFGAPCSLTKMLLFVAAFGVSTRIPRLAVAARCPPIAASAADVCDLDDAAVLCQYDGAGPGLKTEKMLLDPRRRPPCKGNMLGGVSYCDS